MKPEMTFRRTLHASLMAAFITAWLCFVWYWMFILFTDYEIPAEFSSLGIASSSLVGSLAAAFGFYILVIIFKAKPMYFKLTAMVLAILTVVPLIGDGVLPSGNVIPEGFLWLAVPMHLIAGVVIGGIIPWYVIKGLPEVEEVKA